MCYFVYKKRCKSRGVDYVNGDSCRQPSLANHYCIYHQRYLPINNRIINEDEDEASYSDYSIDSISEVTEIEVDDDILNIRNIIRMRESFEEVLNNKNVEISILKLEIQRLSGRVSELELTQNFINTDSYISGDIRTLDNGCVKIYDGINWNYKCTIPDCMITPSYGFEVNIPVRCSRHNDTSMRKVTGKRCKRFVSCGNIIDCKHRNILGLCSTCYSPEVNDDEIRMVNYLKEQFLDESWFSSAKFDQIISLEHCNQRPNILVHTYSGYLIIECDENAHSNFAIATDNNIEKEIRRFLKEPVTFIRWNPTMMVNSQAPITERLECLFDEINYVISKDIENTTIYLYYPNDAIPNMS